MVTQIQSQYHTCNRARRLQ